MMLTTIPAVDHTTNSKDSDPSKSNMSNGLPSSSESIAPITNPAIMRAIAISIVITRSAFIQ